MNRSAQRAWRLTAWGYESSVDYGETSKLPDWELLSLMSMERVAWCANRLRRVGQHKYRENCGRCGAIKEQNLKHAREGKRERERERETESSLLRYVSMKPFRTSLAILGWEKDQIHVYGSTSSATESCLGRRPQAPNPPVWAGSDGQRDWLPSGPNITTDSLTTSRHHGQANGLALR